MTTCVCDGKSWVSDPEPICDKYLPGPDKFCSTCWHDEGCHHATWEKQIRKDERNKVLAEIKQRLGL